MIYHDPKMEENYAIIGSSRNVHAQDYVITIKDLQFQLIKMASEEESLDDTIKP